MKEWIKSRVRDIGGYVAAVKAIRGIVGDSAVTLETENEWIELVCQLELLARHCRLAIDDIQAKRGLPRSHQ